MNSQPTLREVVMSPAWDAGSSRVSRAYIALFLVASAATWYFDGPTLGLRWIPFLLFGALAASLLFATPLTVLKLYLGTKVGISPQRTPGRVLYAGLDVLGAALLVLATRYAVHLVGRG